MWARMWNQPSPRARRCIHTLPSRKAHPPRGCVHHGSMCKGVPNAAPHSRPWRPACMTDPGCARSAKATRVQGSSLALNQCATTHRANFATCCATASRKRALCRASGVETSCEHSPQQKQSCALALALPQDHTRADSFSLGQFVIELIRLEKPDITKPPTGRTRRLAAPLILDRAASQDV